MAKYRNVIAQSDYGPMIVNRFDNMVGLCISRDGHWEKDEIELLQWLIGACYPNEKRIEILDVGAYIGFHTLGFARFPFDAVSVHAFEPQRLVCQMLAGTIALNSLDNVHVHHKAVSHRSGDRISYQSVDYSKDANFGAFELERPTRTDFDGSRLAGAEEFVETVCIDDLDLEHVRLIKLDVEGMEHKALQGACATLDACRPLIFMEYEKTDFDTVKVLLRDADYVAYFAQRPNILCVPKEIQHLKLEGAEPVQL